MDISEKAKKYAEGKAIDALSAAIEQAYLDGYNDGLKHYENERLESIVDGVEYKDLMLQSGTKWSVDYLRDKDGKLIHLNYNEAIKLNIPTLEQFEELCKECDIKSITETGATPSYWEVTGKNSASIRLSLSSIITPSKKELPYNYMFWLQDNNPEDNNRLCAGGPSYMKVKHSSLFMGYKLPVMLVLKKDRE